MKARPIVKNQYLKKDYKNQIIRMNRGVLDGYRRAARIFE